MRDTKINVNKLWNYYTHEQLPTLEILYECIFFSTKRIYTKNKICEIWDSYSGDVKHSSLLGCNTMLLGG